MPSNQKWVKVKLGDGSEIQIKMEIVAIMKNGNDPNTGLPIYMVQATNIMIIQIYKCGSVYLWEYGPN